MIYADLITVLCLIYTSVLMTLPIEQPIPNIIALLLAKYTRYIPVGY